MLSGRIFSKSFAFSHKILQVVGDQLRILLTREPNPHLMLMDADPAATNTRPHSVNNAIVSPDPHEPQETQKNPVHKSSLKVRSVSKTIEKST
jgi:hypothetical protein